jgi:hypothetical protein
VTTGTIFDKTRTSLAAVWQLTTAKNGLSATTLSPSLGVTYRTVTSAVIEHA